MLEHNSAQSRFQYLSIVKFLFIDVAANLRFLCSEGLLLSSMIK